MRVWDVETKECEVIFKFSEPVSALTTNDYLLYVGSWDRMIRVINLNNHQIENMIVATESAISSLLIIDDFVYVSSFENIVRA